MYDPSPSPSTSTPIFATIDIPPSPSSALDCSVETDTIISIRIHVPLQKILLERL